MPRSWLVGCGAETCLCIAGRRAAASNIVNIGGVVVPVTGGRNWIATIPLGQARTWTMRSTGTVTITTADAEGRQLSRDEAPLPPGALGRHVELVSMIVGGR